MDREDREMDREIGGGQEKGLSDKNSPILCLSEALLSLTQTYTQATSSEVTKREATIMHRKQLQIYPIATKAQDR